MIATDTGIPMVYAASTMIVPWICHWPPAEGTKILTKEADNSLKNGKVNSFEIATMPFDIMTIKPEPIIIPMIPAVIAQFLAHRLYKVTLLVIYTV
ncbi:hypothetical protein [Cytobacillus pseudoceanisediminis]|uniref:hypothetical protein n=1 Tax=Cytobacillus pseudoceanisediminis TaxID=3051614 RepID=UPI003C2DBF94